MEGRKVNNWLLLSGVVTLFVGKGKNSVVMNPPC